MRWLDEDEVAYIRPWFYVSIINFLMIMVFSFFESRLTYFFLFLFFCSNVYAGAWTFSRMFLSFAGGSAKRKTDNVFVSIKPLNHFFMVNRGRNVVVPVVLESMHDDMVDLRIETVAAQQPSGSLPLGVSINLPERLSISKGESVTVNLTFMVNEDAPGAGSMVFTVSAKNHGGKILGRMMIRFEVIENEAAD